VVWGHIIVTEVDPLRAQAAMDGYQVLPMEVAAAVGDIFCRHGRQERHHPRTWSE
jgi:S-adenosylhomocysteine hydrolase